MWPRKRGTSGSASKRPRTETTPRCALASADRAQGLGGGAEIPDSALLDHDQILDSDPERPGDVHARFDGHDVAFRQDILRGLAEPGGFMDLQPDAVAEPMAVLVAATRL